MNKKTLGFMMVFLLVMALFVPSISGATLKSADSTINSAPDKLEIKQAPKEYSGDYIYHSVSAYGHVYRGYLQVDNTCAKGACTYSGWLYRDPLPYPTPW